VSSQERKTPWRVEIATDSDVPGIINVGEITWLSSYPNKKHQILIKDVEARFSSDFKKERDKEIKSEMRSGVHTYRIVKENRKIIAYSHLLKEGQFGDFVEIYVLPDFQARGVGSVLIRDGLKWLGKDKPIRLEVAIYNPAIEIYKHYGFKERPNLQQTPDENWNLLPSGIRIPIKFMEKAFRH
jgi:GNAT superfamily N-acetyltransferase